MRTLPGAGGEDNSKSAIGSHAASGRLTRNAHRFQIRGKGASEANGVWGSWSRPRSRMLTAPDRHFGDAHPAPIDMLMT